MTEKHTRREALRRMGRGVAGAALAALGALLVMRSRSRDTGGRERCINRGVCSHCPASGSCRLPRAQVYRRSEKKE